MECKWIFAIMIILYYVEYFCVLHAFCMLAHLNKIQMKWMHEHRDFNNYKLGLIVVYHRADIYGYLCLYERNYKGFVLWIHHFCIACPFHISFILQISEKYIKIRNLLIIWHIMVEKVFSDQVIHRPQYVPTLQTMKQYRFTDKPDYKNCWSSDSISTFTI